MPMNPDIKTQWTTALRSGDYKQGEAWLTQVKPGEPDKDCCLGVLCKLAVAAGIISSRVTPGGIVAYGPEDGDDEGETMILPPAVRDWAGLDSRNPEYTEGDDNYQYGLAGRNDAGMPFPEIADVIDRHF
jgi:hypothetical protein